MSDASRRLATWHHPTPPDTTPSTERPMKVHHVLFLAWIIVFGFWAVRQVSAANKRREGRK